MDPGPYVFVYRQVVYIPILFSSHRHTCQLHTDTKQAGYIERIRTVRQRKHDLHCRRETDDRQLISYGIWHMLPGPRGQPGVLISSTVRGDGRTRGRLLRECRLRRARAVGYVRCTMACPSCQFLRRVAFIRLSECDARSSCTLFEPPDEAPAPTIHSACALKACNNKTVHQLPNAVLALLTISRPPARDERPKERVEPVYPQGAEEYRGIH